MHFYCFFMKQNKGLIELAETQFRGDVRIVGIKTTKKSGREEICYGGRLYRMDPDAKGLRGEPITWEELINIHKNKDDDNEHSTALVATGAKSSPSLSAVSQRLKHLGGRIRLYRTVMPGGVQRLENIGGMDPHTIAEAFTQKGKLVHVEDRNFFVWEAKNKHKIQTDTMEMVMRCMDTRYVNPEVSQKLKRILLDIFGKEHTVGLSVAGGGMYLSDHLIDVLPPEQKILRDQLLEMLMRFDQKISLVTAHATFVKEGEVHGKTCNCGGCGALRFAAQHGSPILTPHITIPDVLEEMMVALEQIHDLIKDHDGNSPFGDKNGITTHTGVDIFNTKEEIITTITPEMYARMTEKEKRAVASCRVGK